MDNTNLPATYQQSNIQIYNATEVLNIFSDALSKQIPNKVLYIRGVYHQQKIAYGYGYDIIKDEYDQQELPVMIPLPLRETLKDGSLVHLGGTLTRKVTTKGYIQLQLRVTRGETLMDAVVTEDDIRKAELRNIKTQRGFKNVDFKLEEILYRGERPKVALVFASTSITMADFDAGKETASSHIDFNEYRVSFAKSNELVTMLKHLDSNGTFDTIALIRGGGGGIEALDELDVLECVVNLNTPIICAVGHVDEKIFIKNLVDSVASTPNGLGTYFSDLVEKVIQKRNNSRAVLIEEVKGQYIKQITSAEKQNKALQEQIEKMTKASIEAQTNFKTQSDALNKQLSTLQQNLNGLQKINEEQAQKFNTTIVEMQKTNASLQETVRKLTEQNSEANAGFDAARSQITELTKKLESYKNSKTILVIIAVASIIAAIVLAIA